MASCRGPTRRASRGQAAASRRSATLTATRRRPSSRAKPRHRSVSPGRRSSASSTGSSSSSSSRRRRRRRRSCRGWAAAPATRATQATPPSPPPPPPPRLRPTPPRLATTTSGRATTSATETTRGSQPRTRTPKTRASSTSSPWVSLSARARSSRTGSPARPSTCLSSTRGCLSRSRRPGCCLARCCCRRCTAAPSQRRWRTSAARWAACSRRSPRRCLTGPTSSIGATATATTALLTITTRRLSPRRSRRPWVAARCRPPRTSRFRCSSTSRCRPRGAGTARRGGRHPRRRMLIRRSWPRRRRRWRRSVQPARRRGARPWRVRCP
mmetsp:Transcript_22975/g.75610  ORF Transcript_22975/g.75610 Transcript_22975/m.75610 type:complete len:326 (-) Transcript_22975:3684-4661(-)